MKEGLTFDDVQILPRYSDVEERDAARVDTLFTRNFGITLPFVASPMDTVCGFSMAKAMWELGGVGIIHRSEEIDKQASYVGALKAHIIYKMKCANSGYQLNGPPIVLSEEEAKEMASKYPIAAAVGVNGDSKMRAKSLLYNGANVLVIDVAHGHHKLVKDMIEWLRDEFDGKFKFDIIAGSIATIDAAIDLQEWGADGLRVGVGGGSVCETRIRTGSGIPQLQAIMDICNPWPVTVYPTPPHSQLEIPVISDGGIRYPGDVAKALAAGADSVMIGSLFAGTDEAPGEYFIAGEWPYNKRMKVYRGLASATTKLKYVGAASHVEGASKMIEARGPVKGIVQDLSDGVTSSMSYVGAHNLSEFRSRSRFIRITSSGLAEAFPHLLR